MNFYEKPLSELSHEEWELICMKCGKCCMCKYSGDGVVHFSNHMCRFFDLKKGICSCYQTRFKQDGIGCKKVSLDLLENELELLPPECAYRRLYEGRGLPSYHPLITGDEQSVVKAGQTVLSMPVISESDEKKAVDELFAKASSEQWTIEKFKEEYFNIHKKFFPRWLLSYPLTSKAKEST